jgi:hypothetical protein
MQNLMPPVDTPDNLFHDGNPTTGVEGTIVTAEFLNDVQGAIQDTQTENIAVLEAAELEPDPTKHDQLLTAIQALITKAVSAAKYVPEVGELFISTKNVDPNTKYPGTTWAYLGEGLTLRTGKADGSDVGTDIGADSVTLSADNLPAHTHSIGGSTGGSTDVSANTSSYDYGSPATSQTDLGSPSTSSFDYGSPATSTGGGHSHAQRAWRDGGGGSNTYIDRNTFTKAGYEDNSSYTVAAGDHAHSVPIGAHSHTVGIGAHAHSVPIGAHSHTVTVPGHSHTLPADTGSVGSGAAISVVSKSKLVMVWERTA